MVNSIRAIAVVRYIVGGRSWEGPLWEVPLYFESEFNCFYICLLVVPLQGSFIGTNISGGSSNFKRVVLKFHTLENFSDHAHFLLKPRPFPACWACCTLHQFANFVAHKIEITRKGQCQVKVRKGSRNDATVTVPVQLNQEERLSQR